MTGLDKRKEERLLRAVKDLSKLPGNKRCADCTEKLPQYVNLTFNTFICTACSGIHREFSHRVKSISLSTFSLEEVKALKDGGNEACAAVYLARWEPRDYAEPQAGDEHRIRDWIRHKYVERRWHVDSNYQPGGRGGRVGSREGGRAGGREGPRGSHPQPLSRRHGSLSSGSRDLDSRGGMPAGTPGQASVVSDTKAKPVVRGEAGGDKAAHSLDLLDLVFAPGSPERKPVVAPGTVASAEAAFATDPFASASGWAGGGAGGGNASLVHHTPPHGPLPPSSQPAFVSGASSSFPSPSSQPPPRFPPPPPHHAPSAGYYNGPAAVPQPPGEGGGGGGGGYPGYPPIPPPSSGLPTPPPSGVSRPHHSPHASPHPRHPPLPPPTPPSALTPPRGPPLPPGMVRFSPPSLAPPPAPLQTLSIDAAFGDLSLSGSAGAACPEGAAPSLPPSLPTFAKGEVVLYTDSQGRRAKTVIKHVHTDDHPPYYTITLPNGSERQTDFHHIAKLPGTQAPSFPPSLPPSLPPSQPPWGGPWDKEISSTSMPVPAFGLQQQQQPSTRPPPSSPQGHMNPFLSPPAPPPSPPPARPATSSGNPFDLF